MPLISTMLVCSLALQPPSRAKADVPPHLANPLGYKAKPNTAYMQLSIPPPMSIEEWEVYARILNLSDEQRRALEGAYDEYRRSDWAFRAEQVQDLYDRSAELGVPGTDLGSPSVASQLAAIYRDGNRMLPEILRIERMYFSNVAQFLAEAQLDELEIVRMMRERSNERQVPSMFPGFHFDLDGMLIALGEAGVDVTPDDPEAFNQLMHAWRSSAASLYPRHGDETRRALELGIVLRAEMKAARAGGQVELAADLQSKYRGVREPATRTARRIHDLHKSYVQLIAERLPSASRQHLVDSFHRSAYKPFMPNRCDLAAIFAEVTAQKLPAEQQTRVDEIREAWETADQSLVNGMLSDYLDWKELKNTNWSHTSEEYSRYSSRMMAAFDSRFAGAEASIAALLDVLTKSQRRDVSKRVDRWRKDKAAWLKEQEEIKIRHRGWPGPHD